MLPETIIKRDGRQMTFDPEKIRNAVKKALVATMEVSDFDEVSRQVTAAVLKQLDGSPRVEIEHVQDRVEHTLMQVGYLATAKAYILYREERSRRRLMKNDLIRTVADLSKETSRDNANVGGSSSAKNFQIGCAASEKYSLLDVIPREFANAHEQGDIHIHDLSWYNLSVNCLQLPLRELLEKGFRVQNGWVRPPKRIQSACALAAIIMQTSQNDMFGGQSFGAFDRDMAQYAEQSSDQETYQAMESFVYSLNMMHSRAGGQVVFSSINIGTDTSEAGRKVTRSFLLAYEAGLGKGEPCIFPNVIFKTKKGVNFNPGDPNYDLFQLACQVASHRLNPTFSFMDSSFNAPHGDQVAYMGCRTRVIANRRGPSVTDKRGNLAFTTVNLPRLALRCKGNYEKFLALLDTTVDLAIRQLVHRYKIMSSLNVKDLPFVMGQHLYLDSEGLGPCDSIEPAIKHGTLTVGFIGLAECLQGLYSAHHGESDIVLEKGEQIVAFMRKMVDNACDVYDLNFALLATPAEGLCGRFVKLDEKEFGIIPGVTYSAPLCQDSSCEKIS